MYVLNNYFICFAACLMLCKNGSCWSFNLGYNLGYNPYCWLKECCQERWIKNDIPGLRNILKERVYGQHLIDEAVNALAAHWSPYYKPQKALTLSFHGWPGGGKNYVSNFIADSLYKEGTKSKYVHHFIGRIHFPLQKDAENYREQLYSWLKGNITNCPKQLFIFDEVDKMQSEVLNAIKPMIDYRNVVDGVDYTKSVFIFLSNTGAGLINEHYEELYMRGMKREDVTLNEFEKLISRGAFNEEGGFHFCDVIKSNLIDHYIPFLPLQSNHVELCITDEFKTWNVSKPKKEHIQEVLDTVDWGPAKTKLFSKTGCRRISSKVGALVAKYYPEAMSKTEL